MSRAGLPIATTAPLPVQAVIDRAGTLDWSTATVSALFLFDPADEVVNATVAETVAEAWRARHHDPRGRHARRRPAAPRDRRAHGLDRIALTGSGAAPSGLACPD